ncbi:DUF2057 domain-containing protein [Photobacterium sp. MCCC 1A19761]|uniref:YccT family protein n=1 Tax=Photobacterium sp. MCCC 1A19761 TaxID=3115000 RepID=UPI00307FBA4B
MKLTQFALATILLPLAPITAAQVTMEIPKGIQLLVINGQDSGYSVFGFDHQPEIQLPDGTNQIAFRISKAVRESGSKKTKFKSVPILMRFSGKDTHLKLEVPNIRTLDEGHQFNTSPSISVKESGKQFPFVYDTMAIGFDLAPDFTREVEKYNQSQAIASIATLNTLPTPIAQAPESITKDVANSTTDTSTQITESNKTEMMLKHWFSQADEETKKQFLSWAVTNIK